MLFEPMPAKEFVKLVKKGPKEYTTYNTMLPVSTEPFDHQKRGFLIATSIPNCALIFDPGLGKTLTTIAVMTKRNYHKQVHRALVIAPLSVIAVWEEQFAEHCSLGLDYELHALDQRKVDDRIKVLEELTERNKHEDPWKLQVVVVNYDALDKLSDAITAWKPDMIVADESQYIKNRKANRTKVLWRLGKIPKYKMILTGTPVTESPLDIWAQYKFLDQNVFGKRYKDFESNFAVMGGYGKFTVKKYKNLKQLARQAYSIGYRVSKEKAIDLPPAVDMIKYCYLTKESEKLYKEMEKNKLIKFLGGADADAKIVLTALLRMQQITGGFLGREDGSHVNTGREKLALLEEFLEDYPQKKLVIFARFTPEIKAIKEVVKKAGRSVEELSGSVKVGHRKELRHKFQKEEDPQVLVVQIAAGGVGIDLFAADTAIFYSHDPSFGKLLQAKGRLDRTGQTAERVTFVHFLARGTIDETIYEALQKKKDLFTLVVDKYLKKEEEVEMSKKHSKKQKFERKRAPETELEQEEMINRLKKVKSKITNEEGGVEEVATTKKPSKKAKGKKVEVSENVVTVKDLADELGVSPTALRKQLRSAGIEKPGGRWEWPEDHEDLDTIRDMFNEEEEEEKPKAKKSKKKAKPEPEPEVEDEEEEEEDEEDDEEEDADEDEDLDEDDDEDDWDEIDYEEMDKDELKELCKERDIKVTKKTTVDQMVEKLIEWDNEQFELDEE